MHDAWKSKDLKMRRWLAKLNAMKEPMNAMADAGNENANQSDEKDGRFSRWSKEIR